MGKREPMATTTTAAEPAVSGAIIEMYARQLDTGTTIYVVEVGGLPVAEGLMREALVGVYLLLKNASEAVVYSLVGQVMANPKPLEI